MILKLMKVWKLMILLSRKRFSSFSHIENGAESKQLYSCLVSAYFLLHKNELQNALELKNGIDIKVKIDIDLQNIIEL